MAHAGRRPMAATRRSSSLERLPRPAMPYMPISCNAALEVVAAPARPLCLRCSAVLSEAEVSWGTGLCNTCYGAVGKDCRLCHNRIPLRQLHWDSGLCSTCFHACDRGCRLCGSEIALQDLDFDVGLCSACYSTCEKRCKLCQSRLELGQLWWGTGLCDTCYSTWHKACKLCKQKPQRRQEHWSTGLCDACHGACARSCRCGATVTLGSTRWRSCLCDACGEQAGLPRSYSMAGADAFGEPGGSAAAAAAASAAGDFHSPVPLRRSLSLPEPGPGSPHRGAGQQAKASKTQVWTCALCNADVDLRAAHWGTGLCDECYNETEKRCRKCCTFLPFGQRHWDIGLCASCHSECVLSCKTCQRDLSQNEKHWGFQLCDTCFDRCVKTCRDCDKPLDLRQLHWGTGVCDECYDKAAPGHPGALSLAVRAAIGAQFVFYMAPEMLKPSLFLHIQSSGYRPDAPKVYAWVQTAASLAAMIVPLPIGRLADVHGKRAAYCGVCLAAMAAAAAFVLCPPAGVFALAWGVLNVPPPAIRGVRQAFFANNVPLQDLSRAGQLASSVGVLGGFVGPVTSTLLALVFTERSDAHWLDGFVAGAFIAIAIFAACAATLWLVMPADATSRHGPERAVTVLTPVRRACEICRARLSDADQARSIELCNACYANFGGANRSFRNYSRHVLICFCVVASLLELSLNAGVMAAFQPVVVEHFGWRSGAIAAVNSAGAVLSLVISLVVAHLRLPERAQTVAAAGLYTAAVLSFSAPPLAEWRLVAGVMMGISAQIMLYAPLEAIFAQLIGRTRVTTRLATVLSLAPAVGTAVGTSAAPACIAAAGSLLALAAALPAALAFLAITAELALGGWVLGAERQGPTRPLLSAEGTPGKAAHAV